MEPYTTEGVARRDYNNSNPQAADTDSESGSVTDLHMSASNSSLQSNVSNVSISTPEIQHSECFSFFNKSFHFLLWKLAHRL